MVLASHSPVSATPMFPHSTARQRDIFPLPPAPAVAPAPGIKPSADCSRTVQRRRTRKLHQVSLVAQMVAGLNALAGTPTASALEPTAVQSLCMEHLSEVAQEFGVPPATLSEAGSLTELCATSAIYGDGSKVVPFDEGRVAWPPVASGSVSVFELVSPGLSEKLKGWKARMLRPVCEAQQLQNESGLSDIYTDPRLIRSPRRYAKFIQKMLKHHMVKLGPQREATTGLFFVRKSDGSYRIICDTRRANTFFTTPDATLLPSAGALAAVEIEPGDELTGAQGDVACAFYQVQLPEDMQEYFILPPVAAALLGITHFPVTGFLLPPGALLSPQWAVLPMGFSWAVHIMQDALEHAVVKAQLDPKVLVHDKRVVQPLSHKSYRLAGFVDNYIALSTHRSVAQSSAEAWDQQLKGDGLVTHDVETRTKIKFNGVTFQNALVQISHEKRWRLKLALQCLSKRGRARGSTLEIVLGHYTWAALIVRSSLTVFDHAYKFIARYGDSVGVLPPEVHRELSIAAAIIPLLRRRLDSTWDSTVHCCDASLSGFGVVSRPLGSTVAGETGRQCERWRFALEDSIAARQSSLGAAAESTLSQATLSKVVEGLQKSVDARARRVRRQDRSPVHTKHEVSELVSTQAPGFP